MNRKALALLSGGLDSTLAIRHILEQDIEVVALNFASPFCRCNRKDGGCGSEARRVSLEFGIELKIIGLRDEYFEIIRHPKHGYGSNVNPCLDCRILMLKKAREYMDEIGASFIITGDVLGQRPMSQRRDAMRTIEKEAGVEGLVLRPLSAMLFSPTIAEKEGIVDRQRLLNFSGRSRKPQMALADEYGVKDYPCPAGGCLLTDPGFAKRMKDLLGHTPSFVRNDIELLKVGRHFRLSKEAKAVVGRDEQENEKLLRLVREGDLLLKVSDYKGPTTLLRGEDEGIKELAARITVRYSDAQEEEIPVLIWKPDGNEVKSLAASPIKEEEIVRYRI